MVKEARPTREEVGKWYDEHLKTHEKYAKCVHDLLETLLEEAGLPYHSITYRAKGRKSFLDKYEGKGYQSPEEITDVAALRVIAYTTADVKHICDLVERELAVDRENSGDKAKQMDSDQVGYLSVHYVVTLPPERAKLGEYKAFAGLKCEIQVRTLLQHAWAEIEHDRSYKFGGVLPKDIKRRFYLLAGVLELADREFQNLADEIDAYGKRVAEETAKGELDIPIDTISLTEFMRRKFPALEPGGYWSKGSSEVIEELEGMGAKTLAELEAMVTPEIVEKIIDVPFTNNYFGALRSVMILHDADLYFRKAWKKHWAVTSPQFVQFWQDNGVDVNAFLDKLEVRELM